MEIIFYIINCIIDIKNQIMILQFELMIFSIRINDIGGSICRYKEFDWEISEIRVSDIRNCFFLISDWIIDIRKIISDAKIYFDTFDTIN